MKIKTLILWLLSMNVLAEDIVTPNISVVPEDKTYYTQDVRNTRIIYTQDNKEHAEYTAGFEKILQPLYEKTFGYQMDTPLSVGIISSYNQIANGFSTQYPSNRQVNYMGGAQLPDYFASTSWLDTLLLHETAHNYQTNVKDNAISRSMYTVFRNGGFLLPFFPATNPNNFESSFILEGNAVLNESWHGRGGRLYSGRYRAMNRVHANAGYLTKERLYNSTLDFPYGEGHYIFGSHYQYYLAETYGLDVTNSYFKYRSKNWYFPFMVNAPTKRTFGVSFDATFSAWVEQLEKESKSLKLVEGKVLARSKYYSDMNTQDQEVLFLANETGVNAPKLYQYDKESHNVTSKDKSLVLGRVFKIDNEYYTISGRYTSPWRITQGLFDDDGMIKPDTKGRIIQGYLSDGRAVYFDAAKSYVSPQLYIEGEFYRSVNSSVLIKDDHLYYFVQQGKERILYKDKQPLYKFEAFYSIVADVDNTGAIYFIANSKLGSSLYKVKDTNVSRVLEADNIVAAKLVGNNQVVVEAISADDYYYALTDLKIINQAPFVVKYIWDDPDHPLNTHAADFNNVKSHPLDLTQEYSFFDNVNYTSGNFFSSTNDEDESVYYMSATFSDPLAYHQFTLKGQKDADQSTLVGFRYSNNQHFLLFGLDAFYVAKDGLEEFSPIIETRDYGVAVDAKLPFLRKGYWSGQLQAGYYQDYINIEREPTSVNLTISRSQSFGHSFYYNNLAYLNVFSTQDRSDQINGADISLSTDLPFEFYIGIKGKYSKSDGDADRYDNKGVELSSSGSFVGVDSSGFFMPSLKQDTFVKKAAVSEVSLSKVFNGSFYFFKFPISLRRESLSLAYRQYQIEGVPNENDLTINQLGLKLSLETVLVNNYVVRFNIESIYNDNDVLTEKNSNVMTIGIGF